MSPLEEAERQSRLWHIADACAAIIRFTEGRTLSDYSTDDMLHSAVERQLTIIGEAMVRLRKGDPEIASAITNMPNIIAFRHKLIHEYPEIDDNRVWELIHNQVPLLLAEVRALLPPAP